MPSLPSLKIFPSWCLEDVTVNDEFSTTIIESHGAETTNANWSDSRFVIDLSGGLCTREQLRALKSFNRWACGRRRKFLYRRYDDAEWEMSGPDGSGEFLGVGDGVQTVFQARICDDVQGELTWKTVYALDHDVASIGRDAYGQPFTKTRLVEVFLDGARQTEGVHYTVEREGGRIVFLAPVPIGVAVKLRGGFFAVVRFNQEGIKTKPKGGGWWEIADGVALIEPKGAVL